MRPSLIFSLLSFAGSIVLAILATQIQQYEGWFWAAAACCVVAAFGVWTQPKVSAWLLAWPRGLEDGSQLPPKIVVHNAPDSQPSSDIKRDVWLSDAIWRAYLGAWHIPPGDGLLELNVSESEKRRFAMLVIRDFRQIASEGTLPIWGWKGTSTLWEKVPNEFWKNNHIEYIQVATNGPPDEVKAQAENPYEQDISKEWHHFMTSKAVIEQLYPSPQ